MTHILQWLNDCGETLAGFAIGFVITDAIAIAFVRWLKL
jgi:hypothetical protein